MAIFRISNKGSSAQVTRRLRPPTTTMAPLAPGRRTAVMVPMARFCLSGGASGIPGRGAEGERNGRAWARSKYLARSMGIRVISSTSLAKASNSGGRICETSPTKNCPTPNHSSAALSAPLYSPSVMMTAKNALSLMAMHQLGSENLRSKLVFKWSNTRSRLASHFDPRRSMIEPRSRRKARPRLSA